MRMPESSYQHQKEKLFDEIKCDMMVQKVGAIILPLVYLGAWLLIRVSSNAQSFVGIGTSAFGLPAPHDVNDFVRSVLFFWAIEFAFAAISYGTLLWLGVPMNNRVGVYLQRHLNITF